MKLKTVIFAVASVFCGVASAASINGVLSDVIPGEWTSSFSAAKKYAEDNGVPLFIIWSNPGCAHCNKVKEACNQSDFVAWRKARKYIMVVSEGDGNAKRFVKGLKGNMSGKYPFLGIYWPKGGVSEKFNGYPYSSIWSTGSTTQAKIMNRVDARLAAWVGGGGDPGSGTSVTPVVPSTPVIGSEWNRARKLYGSINDGNGNVVGRLVVSAGKVSKGKGTAKIKAQVLDLNGRAKMLGSKDFTVDRATSGRISSRVGSAALTIQGANLSGTVTLSGENYEVSSRDTAGSIADGVLYFMLNDPPTKCQGNPVIDGTAYLPVPQRFRSSSSRWSFARKGSLRYDSRNKAFVMTATDNPSGLKLSYTSSTGYFKGTFTVYARRGERTIKRYTAKVGGFMRDGSGHGQAVIRGVGTFECSITPNEPIKDR